MCSFYQRWRALLSWTVQLQYHAVMELVMCICRSCICRGFWLTCQISSVFLRNTASAVTSSEAADLHYCVFPGIWSSSLSPLVSLMEQWSVLHLPPPPRINNHLVLSVFRGRLLSWHQATSPTTSPTHLLLLIIRGPTWLGWSSLWALGLSSQSRSLRNVSSICRTYVMMD